MALFKISKGLKANLPSTKKVGNCWYTTDDSLFYIDYEDENGVVQRKALNAKDAETITGASLATILNSTDLEIPTSKTVLNALAGKSDTNHTHDGRYYTEAEVDSKLSTKVDVVSGKGLSTNDYTTTEKNKLSGIASGAEVNQNAFSNIVVGATTIAADTKTDTLTLVGSNITITPDTTNDKVTFSVADGTTNAKGVVQLTNSTSSTSTTTAATPSSVKSAYDLANTAKTNADNAQAKADEAYDLADLAANMVYIGPTAPTDPNIKVWINTSEEGTGVIPVLPRISTITLAANAWSGSAEPYSQSVDVATVTTSSKVDLQPSAAQIASLQNAETSLMIENNGGSLTCYAIGNKPTVDYIMQVLIQEVAYV